VERVSNHSSPTESVTSLEVLKALGDNTRYAIYLELARASAPLATAEVAEQLDLHVNTVRPHLERMREVGLLDVSTTATGGVGRPQHRYSLASDAPSLGLEPPVFPTLARMLLQMAVGAGAGSAHAIEAGSSQGRVDAQADRSAPNPQALVAHLETLGFAPRLETHDDGAATVTFASCPFGDLAHDNPQLVCGVHEGLIEGFLDELGGCQIHAFHTLNDGDSCQVELVSSP
jgi:predicted ArsR family transcriptional regulator